MAVLSYKTFGNVPIEAVKGSLGTDKFIFAYIKKMQESRLRADKKGKIVEALFCKSLNKRGLISVNFDNFSLPLYEDDTTKWKRVNGADRCAMWVISQTDGYDYYGLPDSIESITQQTTEYATARYNLDCIENGMVVSGVFLMHGNGDDSETKKVARKIVHTHTGEGKRGRIAVINAQDADRSKFESFDTSKEGSFSVLKEELQADIILSHQWDSVLAGLQTKNSFGKGGNYLKEAYLQKKATVIIPLQKIIMDNFVIPFLEVAKEHLGKKWDLSTLKFQEFVFDTDKSTHFGGVAGSKFLLELLKSVKDEVITPEQAKTIIKKNFNYDEDEIENLLPNV